MSLTVAASLWFGFASGEASAQADVEGRSLAEQAIPLLAQKRFDEAARMLYRAASLSPNEPVIQYDLGIAFEGLNRFTDAWKAFARASQLEPSNADFALALAHAYAECGDKKRCASMLRDCQKRFRFTAEQQQKLNELLAYYDEGQGQTQALTRVVTGDPTDPAGWLMLAANYNKQSKQAEAISVLQTGIRRFPQNADLHGELGYVLLKSGKFKEATAEYQLCCKLDPNNSHYYQNIMYCQNKSGDLDGLQATRKLFVQKFPQDAQAKVVGDEITFYDKDFASTRQREATQSEGIAPFISMQMPIKIFVHDRFAGRTTWSAKQTGAPAKINYSLKLEQAFDEWSGASLKRLTFIFVDLPDNSNIECEWTTDRDKLHYSFAGGVTQYSRNKLGEPKANIYLLSDTSSDAEFYETCLHEIGHALGLQHSSNPADVMYFSGQNSTSAKSSPSLSANDILRLKKLYNIQ